MALPSYIREAFALFDKDGDGEVTSVEATLVMRSCGMLPTANEINALPTFLDWPTFEGIASKK